MHKAMLLATLLAAFGAAEASLSSRKLLQTSPPPVCTVPTELGTTVNGYTYGSNIAGYPQISVDILDIAALVNRATPDFTQAKAIFDNGKNSKRSTCALRTLRSWATSDNAGDPIWGLYANTFSAAGATFMSTFADEALNGTGALASASPAVRAAFLNTLSQSFIQTVYMMHEIDVAWNRTGLGQTGDASGAPHNLDEAVGIWAGTGVQSPGSLDGLALLGAQAAGTLEGTRSRAGNKAMADFVGMQAASRANNTALVGEFRIDVIKQLIVIHAEAILNYASTMSSTDAIPQALAAGYFRSIQPLVAQTSPAAASEVAAVINFGASPAADAVSKIKTALVPVYAAYNITAEDLGQFATPSEPTTGPISLSSATTTQSSTDGTHAAALAIDGKAATYAATGLSFKPWWGVNLSKEHAITSVTITVPASGPALKDLHIKVGSTAPVNSPQGVNTQCAVKTGEAVAAGKTATFTCAKELKGSWVTVQVKTKTGDGQLALQEVQLTGYAA